MIVCVEFAFMGCWFALVRWWSGLLYIAFAMCFRLFVLGVCGCCAGIVVFIRLCAGFRVGLWCGCAWLFYLVCVGFLGCSECFLI